MNTIKAIVQNVIPDGNHGPFAVALSDQLDGSVTFSLDSSVWKESEWPENGTIVFLGKLRKKRAGWRAKEGRFWKLSDEQTQQIEKSKGIQFLYPMVMQFPFDSVSQQIILELEKRNWSVPDISVDFSDYGSGEQKFRMVSYVKHQNFELHFGRVQHTMPGGRWNDTAAITSIVIPRKEIHVYNDESGPTFYLYVGSDWGRDREKFMHGVKVNSKLRGEPRMYLEYKGSASKDGSYHYAGQRPRYLVHTNDLGRQYDPRGAEPKFFLTETIMEEFRKYMEEVVLQRIVSHPIPKEKIAILVPPPIPFPESIAPIFCFGEYDDARRIKEGQEDPSKLEPADRYALSGSGYRLLTLGTPNDGTVPEVAYDGFLWCGIGAVTSKTPIDSLEVPGHNRWSDRERFVIRIKPNRSDGIYVADHSAYEKRRKELSDASKDERDRFTNAEVADFMCARARTIVPIHEYKGNYEKPLVLIRRELSFDEVELVSGPHKDRFGR